MSSSERFSRQADVVPRARLLACTATVVGTGAIGRQVALQLSAMGVARLQLVDFDRVEASNLASQGYRERDLGQLKVSATADACQALNSELALTPVPRRFRRSLEVGNALFCCVDRIDTRRLLWEAVESRTDFFSDGRMSAEVVRVVTACDRPSRVHYPRTLFASEDAHTGACTAKSTIFTANITAGLMVEQFSRWLRNLPIDPDLQLNLLSSELTVSGS
jgi:ThiF family protein